MASKILIESQSKRIESLLSVATNSVNLLRDPSSLKQTLAGERDRLLQEIEKLKTALIIAEIRNGKKQFFSSFMTGVASNELANAANTASQGVEVSSNTNAKPAEKQPEKSKAPKEKPDKKPKAEAPPAAPEKVDVSRLDMRVGLITEASKHPEADKLYVEKVNCGDADGKIRTVVSGLAAHIPLDEMQNRLCVFLCNLKPAKLRGIASEAMVMCANKDGVVRILTPPAGCKPGDRVLVDGFPGQPDAVLNPKLQVWEQVMPDLLTDDAGRAAYKGVPWTINGGYCTCDLTSAQIK